MEHDLGPYQPVFYFSPSTPKEDYTKKSKELYDFQINELNLYPISIEYEKKLIKKYNFLSNASYIKDTLSEILKLFDNDESAILNSLAKIFKEFFSQ